MYQYIKSMYHYIEENQKATMWRCHNVGTLDKKSIVKLNKIIKLCQKQH